MYGKTEGDIALANYKAYNALCNEYEIGGIVSRKEREKKAKKALDTVIRKMNPLDISSETKGRVLSKKQEFLNYLSEENKTLALKLESEYNYKVRLFNKIIKSKEYRDKYSIYPYD